jgi:hypothetical protein
MQLVDEQAGGLLIGATEAMERRNIGTHECLLGPGNIFDGSNGIQDICSYNVPKCSILFAYISDQDRETGYGGCSAQSQPRLPRPSLPGKVWLQYIERWK